MYGTSEWEDDERWVDFGARFCLWRNRRVSLRILATLLYLSATVHWLSYYTGLKRNGSSLIIYNLFYRWIFVWIWLRSDRLTLGFDRSAIQGFVQVFTRTTSLVGYVTFGMQTQVVRPTEATIAVTALERLRAAKKKAVRLVKLVIK